MCGVYRKPDLVDKIFISLLNAMATIQSVDKKASLIVCEVTAHHMKSSFYDDDHTQ